MITGILKSRQEEADVEAHGYQSRRYRVRMYLETTANICKEINAFKDEENEGQNQDFNKNHYNIDPEDDHFKIAFKDRYTKRIDRPFGRL